MLIVPEGRWPAPPARHRSSQACSSREPRTRSGPGTPCIVPVFWHGVRLKGQ